MPANPVERKLAAILAAEIAGLGSVGADEEGTLAVHLDTGSRLLADRGWTAW
jgi:hypothetical protein